MGSPTTLIAIPHCRNNKDIYSDTIVNPIKHKGECDRESKHKKLIQISINYNLNGTLKTRQKYQNLSTARKYYSIPQVPWNCRLSRHPQNSHTSQLKNAGQTKLKTKANTSKSLLSLRAVHHKQGIECTP